MRTRTTWLLPPIYSLSSGPFNSPECCELRASACHGASSITGSGHLAPDRAHRFIDDDGENDWLTNESDDYIRDHIGNMIAYSKMIKNGCEKHGLSYFDTSEDFLGAIEAATDFLVGDLN